ncbi:unnamed protein product [Durusdinium trenchii]|uniref:Translocation protein SEC62 n=3 Tax=Durusdinium trenchii TaxID=1381693 RepID=A0ABP0L209_9DINO
MRGTPQFGHVQMKAILFLVLLAGHECIRVDDEIEWSKSKWDQLHADCSWSIKGGCKGEGCVKRRLPLDRPFGSCRHTDSFLLKHNGLQNYKTMLELLQEKSQKYSENCAGASIFNRKCKRREAQIMEAFEFIARAPTDQKFMSQLNEEEKATVHAGFDKTLKSLVPSDAYEVIQVLVKKMKGHGPELKRDLNGAMLKVSGLVQKLLQGSPEEKQAAKEAIMAMPDTVPALSEEEEAEATKKAQEFEKEADEHRGDLEAAFDQVEKEGDEVIESEADDSDSALQIGFDPDEEPNPVMLVGHAITPISIGLVIATVLIGATGLLAVFYTWLLAIGYFILGLFVCFIPAFILDDFDPGMCMSKFLAFPFHAIKYLAKGAWRLGKKLVNGTKSAYRNWRGKDTSGTVEEGDDSPTPDS